MKSTRQEDKSTITSYDDALVFLLSLFFVFITNFRDIYITFPCVGHGLIKSLMALATIGSLTSSWLIVLIDLETSFDAPTAINYIFSKLS